MCIANAPLFFAGMAFFLRRSASDRAAREPEGQYPDVEAADERIGRSRARRMEAGWDC